jgi:hypothetical protein
VRGAAAALVCVGIGLLTGDALADLVPVPTVPTVTVPAPTVPVPTVPVPTVPVPAPTPTVPALPAPTPPSTSTSPSLPGTTLAGATNPSVTPTATAGGSVPVQFSALGATSSGRGSTPSSTSSSSSASSRGPSGPQVKHFQSSRPWITTTGKQNRRSTILTFVLKRPTRVIFTVKQLAPDCQTVGRFSVRGRAGLNRVRFSGRVGRRELAAGTYRITARTVNGRTLQRLTIVVVDGGAPTKAELAALRASNVCSNGSGIASTGSTGASSTGGLSGTDFGDFFTPEQPSASGPKSSGGALGGVLGSATVERTAKAIRPGLVALLAAAILLLGLGSLPRLAVADARVNEALARHRAEITIVGAVALIAVIVTFLVG